MNTILQTKIDPFTGKTRTCAERLDDAHRVLSKAQNLLAKFDRDLHRCSNELTEEQLQAIVAAVDNAYWAAANAANIGYREPPHPLEAIGWPSEEEG